MKQCPVCKGEIKGFGKRQLTFGRFLTRCPHCGRKLRKKITHWFPLLLIAFGFCVANFKTHLAFAVASILLAVAATVLLYYLPFVPYDPAESAKEENEDCPL